MKIGIIVAMSVEFDLIVSQFEQSIEKNINSITFIEGKIAGIDLILMKSGMGKVCSTIGAMEMINCYHPDCIINTGVAGGIDSSLAVMDIVVGECMVYHDVWCGEGNEYGQIQGLPLYYPSDPHLLAAARNIKESGLKVGLICSGDKFITAAPELQFIKQNFPKGLAVDMESCSIAQTCYLYQTPFLSMRIISDIPGGAEHLQEYKDFWQKAPEKSFRVFKELIELIGRNKQANN
ncbi:5'-methylthioadenosine/S-adenosylhomocysteine nucleosidase [Bacteroidia bacterium]|nr:5'-methylthioadenosine/S-adenosylhomocysteine nucleosidase [Bacteroidia bacterium]